MYIVFPQATSKITLLTGSNDPPFIRYMSMPKIKIKRAEWEPYLE